MFLDGSFEQSQDLFLGGASGSSVFVIRPHGYLAIAARGVVDTDELVSHLKATFR